MWIADFAGVCGQLWMVSGELWMFSCKMWIVHFGLWVRLVYMLNHNIVVFFILFSCQGCDESACFD